MATVDYKPKGSKQHGGMHGYSHADFPSSSYAFMATGNGGTGGPLGPTLQSSTGMMIGGLDTANDRGDEINLDEL